MNILLVGGSGFVSGTLAQVAVGGGHSVWAVTRGERPVPEGVTGITADRKDRAAFAQAVASHGTRWELVVDCIGYDPDDAQQDIDVFGDSADSLVFISTDFVYDPARRNFPQRADNPFFIAEGYGAKKRQCEELFLATDPGQLRWTVIRPCHIYGPGSRLGCLPEHGRDPQLIERLRAGESLRLVGGGHFLQQPVFAVDLADLILSCAGNAQADRQVYQAAGPDIIESVEYYRIIADVLGVDLEVTEVPVGAYLTEHPEHASFLCHRIYDLGRLAEHGLCVPATPIREGLRAHVLSMEPEA